jgi:hypothetical protein
MLEAPIWLGYAPLVQKRRHNRIGPCPKRSKEGGAVVMKSRRAKGYKPGGAKIVNQDNAGIVNQDNAGIVNQDNAGLRRKPRKSRSKTKSRSKPKSRAKSKSRSR